MQYEKLKTTVLFLLLGLAGLHAQETVSATGGDATGTGGSSSYSIGQVVYTTNSGTNGSVSQGVQQSYEISTTTGIEVSEINLELSTYPNPTTSFLNLDIGNYNNEKLTYQLYDIQGKLLDDKRVTSNSTTIKMESLPPSTYFLKIINSRQLVKTFKIIKN